MDNPFKMNNYSTKAELNQRVMCAKYVLPTTRGRMPARYDD